MCLAEMAVLDGFLKLGIRVGDSLAKKKDVHVIICVDGRNPASTS